MNMDSLKERAARAMDLAYKATPAPWKADFLPESNYRAEVTAPTIRGILKTIARCPSHNRGTPEANAALIAASHDHVTLIRDLMAEVERLQAYGEPVPKFTPGPDGFTEANTRPHSRKEP